MSATNNEDIKNWTDNGLWEQKEEPVPKKRSCCFLGCLVLFVCLIVLCLCTIDFNNDIFRSRYPIELTEDVRKIVPLPEGGCIIEWKVSVETVKGWIIEEGKDQLFFGTWQLERPIGVVYYLFGIGSDWEKTRLEIRPDNTFILTDPYEGMESLHNFRETVSGTWEASFSLIENTIKIYFTLETKVPDRMGDPARLRPLDLWTLYENDTSNQYLRLHPNCDSYAGDVQQYSPSWKKVIE